jgi:hypothetical protein
MSDTPKPPVVIKMDDLLTDPRPMLAELGRGSLQRRAEDLARLVDLREQELASLRELLLEAHGLVFADDFDHERVRHIRSLLGTAKRLGVF